MSRKNCLVKFSGDVFLRDDVLNWIKVLTDEYFVVICVGGGTQINEAFAKKGFPVGNHGPLGRETKGFGERQLARDVLELNQCELQGKLAELGIHASVVIPVIDIGKVFCHVNDDLFTLIAYHGFDAIYVVTTDDRVSKKEELFAPYEKIKVIGFPLFTNGQKGEI